MPKINMTMDDPVLVARSAPGETRWGFHQFPAINRMPDGRLLLMYADAEDASETHGAFAPSYISGDEGKSWEEFKDGSITPRRPHFAVSKVFDGEYLVVPSMGYFDFEKNGIKLPEPAAIEKTYGILYTYRVSDLPPAVQEYLHCLPAKRWRPDSRKWDDTTVEYDMNNLLAWRRENSVVLPRTFFERTLLACGDELLYADYRGRFACDDGFVAGKGHSVLMVSKDNGRSFKRRGVIAMDRTNTDLMGEPHLSKTADGRLVCAIRRTDHNQKPMCITWSKDGGRTWTPVNALFEFGVWPCLLLLGNGTLVLSYGRPGVHLAFDSHGTGEKWDASLSLIKGDPAKTTKHTCGYTSLILVDDNSFLIAYSDFLHMKNGIQHKAILTRRIKVNKD